MQTLMYIHVYMCSIWQSNIFLGVRLILMTSKLISSPWKAFSSLPCNVSNTATVTPDVISMFCFGEILEGLHSHFVTCPEMPRRAVFRSRSELLYLVAVWVTDILDAQSDIVYHSIFPSLPSTIRDLTLLLNSKHWRNSWKDISDKKDRICASVVLQVRLPWMCPQQRNDQWWASEPSPCTSQLAHEASQTAEQWQLELQGRRHLLEVSCFSSKGHGK